MMELIAEGENSGEVWRRALPSLSAVVLGREPSVWSIPWEKWLSRRHAELRWDNERLHVEQLPEAANPIFLHGEPSRKFTIEPGDCFVIGHTVFKLSAESSASSSEDAKAVVHSYTVTADELRRVPFRDAPHRLDVLRQLAQLIFSGTNDAELFTQTANLLLQGIRKAEAVAIVCVEDPEGESRVRVLHADRRGATPTEFQPSKHLVRDAVLKVGNSVVHVWAGGGDDDDRQQFTLSGNYDWAFCTPLRGEACKHLAIYVAGRLSGGEPGTILAPWQENDLSEDVKFTELVAAIVGALRETQSLQHRQSVLSHFFSPSVLRVLSASAPEAALRPQQTRVTVLFCDLRGFSRKVESAAADLPGILERVSAALGVMSAAILQHGGAVADFLGDCAMAFWGWPIARPDDLQQACLAAIDIRAAFDRFSREPNHPLSDFRVGVGIATGTAVAGQIGSQDQAKVTVFGPVVNLASRLEGLTKILRVPILIDEETAAAARKSLPPTAARVRRIAAVRPFGLDTSLTVSELLLPAAQNSVLTDEHVQAYEAALTDFLAGRWDQAYEQLHHVPPDDHGKDFLMSFILQHQHTPPAGWDGVIPIESKR